MEEILLKTVDPISQEILISAARRNIPLLWERFEKLQPQDGFLRLGLSCPYGCLQGPCRIDPFGRGADRGICGLDRDGMTAALLLRLTLFGCLESWDPALSPKKPFPSRVPAWEKLTSRAVKNLGGGELSSAEMGESARLLYRPMAPPEVLIRRALRLSLLALTFTDKSIEDQGWPRPFSVRVGYGLLSEKRWNIAIGGRPETKHLEVLARNAAKEDAQLFSLGEWVLLGESFLPIVCSSGEGELALATGQIQLLIAGAGTDPALIEFCRSSGIPYLSSEDAQDQKRVRQHLRPKGESLLSGPLPVVLPPVEGSQVVMDVQELARIIKKKAPKRLAFLGGADTPQQSLGWIPGEVATSLVGGNCLVGAWGDAALWNIKKKLCSPEYKTPVQVLNAGNGPILALKASLAVNRMKDLKICFMSFRSCKDLALALGSAILGAKTCAAAPLPLWGSEKCRQILADHLSSQGGALQHFDHPPQAQEILDWFTQNDK